MNRLQNLLFWVASVAYAGMATHLGLSIYQGHIGTFTMFGGPGGLVLFGVFLTDRSIPLRARLTAGSLGVVMEVLRVRWLWGLDVPASAANMSIFFGSSFQDANVAFGFPYGFGLAMGFAASLGLWTRVVIEPRPRNSRNATEVASLMLAQVFMLYSMALVGFVPADLRTFDVQLFTFERALGIDIPATLGKALGPVPVVMGLASLAYGTLSAAAFGAYFVQRRQEPPAPVNMLTVSGIAALAAAIYVVVPACGPEQVFGARFPEDVPVDFEPYMQRLDPALFRNAIPSLHATWAFLVWLQMFFYQPSRIVRLAATVFLFFVLIATQASGAHYFVDIVVAVPVALAAQALAFDTVPMSDGARRNAVIAGIVMLGTWLVLLCFAPWVFNRYSAWGAIALTVAACAFFLRRLMAAGQERAA